MNTGFEELINDLINNKVWSVSDRTKNQIIIATTELLVRDSEEESEKLDQIDTINRRYETIKKGEIEDAYLRRQADPISDFAAEALLDNLYNSYGQYFTFFRTNLDYLDEDVMEIQTEDLPHIKPEDLETAKEIFVYRETKKLRDSWKDFRNVVRSKKNLRSDNPIISRFMRNLKRAADFFERLQTTSSLIEDLVEKNNKEDEEE